MKLFRLTRRQPVTRYEAPPPIVSHIDALISRRAEFEAQADNCMEQLDVINDELHGDITPSRRTVLLNKNTTTLKKLFDLDHKIDDLTAQISAALG